MRILVTGGTGFIGSHIVDAYIESGHEVSVIDSALLGREANMNKKARYHEVDIRNREELYRVFEKEKPDVVNHHGALASVKMSVDNPEETMDVNVLGTTHLLNASGEFGVKKFLFASTGGAIYGNPENIPADENTLAQPPAPYGLSKFLAEEGVISLAEVYGYKYLIFRYANVYGPRQDPNGEAGVVAIFGNLMREGKQPTIFGDGSKTRDYVYVGDVVEANVLGLDKGENEILNIGTGKEISDKEVFDEVAECLEYEGEPNYVDFRDGEVWRIALDASLAREVLGWEPKVNFKDGVRIALGVN